MSCEPGGLSFTLNSGHSIPAVGLGVYQAAHGDEAYEACLNALRMGYRHIDTAQIYRNEASVGKAIKDSGIPRENIFVTTKFWAGGGHGRTNAVDALKGSLALLMLSYVDLYLMHSPGKAGAGRAESWAGMEDSVKQGLARSIGVSNYGVEHLKAYQPSRLIFYHRFSLTSSPIHFSMSCPLRLCRRTPPSRLP